MVLVVAGLERGNAALQADRGAIVTVAPAHNAPATVSDSHCGAGMTPCRPPQQSSHWR